MVCSSGIFERRGKTAALAARQSWIGIQSPPGPAESNVRLDVDPTKSKARAVLSGCIARRNVAAKNRISAKCDA
jgi:hypothetical protein